MTFAVRLVHSLLALAKAVDIVLCTVWQGALYPFGLADKPSGRRFVSTLIGEAAYNGHRWATVLARGVDWLFAALGDGPEHCRRAFLKYGNQDD